MQNFMQIRVRGVSPQMGEIYANFFIYTNIPFFRNSPTSQTLRRIFACDGSNDAVSLAQGCAVWGFKNLKLIFNVFIYKLQGEKYNVAYGGN